MRPQRERLFQPGVTVWRVEDAARASVLIDAAAYFGAVRAAYADYLPRDRHPVLALFVTGAMIGGTLYTYSNRIFIEFPGLIRR